MLLMFVEAFHKMLALYRNGVASLGVVLARIPSLASRLESMCAVHLPMLYDLRCLSKKKRKSLSPSYKEH